eukprot:gene13360-16287_t
MYKNYTRSGIPIRYIRKILFIMRLITVILIASMVQVSAASYAQKLTLVQKEVTMLQLFKEIKKQTDFNVVWNEKKLNVRSLLDADFINTPLSEVLTKTLNTYRLTYIINKKTIVIKEKEKTMLEKIQAAFDKSISCVGRVSDDNGKWLKGASVIVKGTNKSTVTDDYGYFVLHNVEEKSTLLISYVGFEIKEIPAVENIGAVKLSLSTGRLEEVQIVSTGYQNIPKERATGSFVLVDSALLNRRVSTNILDRLDGVTSGLIFTNNRNHQFGQSNIEIRGRATLFSNPDPLIILDNFPYDGDLSNINPNDIENVTILKDAAAASAWGARSGNGVIVITTKKGSLNTKAIVSLNANVNIGGKPDLYYSPQLTSSEYIDIEQFLFNKGAYNNNIKNGYSALSPAVEIFLAKRNGTISTVDSINKINQLKGFDAREQLLKYYYKPIVNQQYQASVSGGGPTQKYFLSAGYDKNANGSVGNSYSRVTLNANNTYYFLNNKLELFSSILYTNSKTESIPGIAMAYPYSQLADENGAPIVVAAKLRPSYAASAGGGKLLNWLFRPLDELNKRFNNNKNDLTDYRINLSLSYKIMLGLKASAYYTYEKGNSENTTLHELESYYSRNFINTFSQITNTGAVVYPVPMGGIQEAILTNMKSHNGRFQLNYEKLWQNHSVNAIAGYEIRSNNNFSSSNTLYGYNPETASNQNVAVNYTGLFPSFYGSGSDKIPTGISQLGTDNRFVSFYFNGAYTYSQKYIASLSLRRDESNLFGVTINQKGVPLWSAGLAWNLSTFGYTGNVNTNISAYLTAKSLNEFQIYNAYSTRIFNPPNPSLKWEKIKNLNLGLDFSIKGDRLTGSVDYWTKSGIDLIGNSPIAPQTGITLFTGNSANTFTKGVDLQFNSINLNGFLKWQTTLLYNYSSSKVTDYKVANGTNSNVVSANFNNPLQGYPYYSIFSFRYGGLNASGDPQGYLNGVLSTDYNGILNSKNRSELIYNGSAVPTSFGSLRNYFTRPSLDNSVIYSGAGNNYTVADYTNRWQKPGDELTTNVPSLVYPIDLSRSSLYTYSDVLVEKGDHIRLQDMRLGFSFGKKNTPFRNLNLFTYINNIGILWRANKNQIDPDYPTDKKPSTNILQPVTLSDFQNLLDNTNIMNYTGGLAQLACDDYVVDFSGWQVVPPTQRNSYIWDADLYGGEVGIRDWNFPYQQIFYTNSVLDGLSKSDSLSSARGQYLKGWALFNRAFAFYELTRNFCKAYDPATAASDLGIPLRLTAGIDYTLQRSTLQQSFDQILNDLLLAVNLLPADRPSMNLNRPSKIAGYALLARIYLDMRNYSDAEKSANQCLNLYSNLIDYNLISRTSTTPFSTLNDELIYNAMQVSTYFEFTGTTIATVSRVNPSVINSYSNNDLRLLLYFSKLTDNTYTKKRGYNGTGSYAFTGLATDEVYLIKSETLARRGQINASMDILNQLLIKRFDKATTYVPVTANNPNDALEVVLRERRKELIWRGLRWYDLKRLNKEGAAISIERVLNGKIYTIGPNDSRYVFPIPSDEISLSGIQQNQR